MARRELVVIVVALSIGHLLHGGLGGICTSSDLGLSQDAMGLLRLNVNLGALSNFWLEFLTVGRHYAHFAASINNITATVRPL